MEKSRLSARQKDRNSGIILSYKSTKKATFFLLKKARRCARVPSDMSSSICRSPELASVSRYRLAAATWLRQRIHALSYDWRAHKSHAPDQPGCRGLGAVLYQTKAKVRNIQLQGHNFKFTQSLASSAKTKGIAYDRAFPDFRGVYHRAGPRGSIRYGPLPVIDALPVSLCISWPGRRRRGPVARRRSRPPRMCSPRRCSDAPPPRCR